MLQIDSIGAETYHVEEFASGVGLILGKGMMGIMLLVVENGDKLVLLLGKLAMVGVGYGVFWGWVWV